MILNADVYIGLGIQALLLAAAWGRSEALASSNRKRQDERHTENQGVLQEIRGDVKRINGTVFRHDELLKVHADEIERLRDEG